MGPMILPKMMLQPDGKWVDMTPMRKAPPTPTKVDIKVNGEETEKELRVEKGEDIMEKVEVAGDGKKEGEGK